MQALAVSKNPNAICCDRIDLAKADHELTYQADASTTVDWTLDGREKSRAHMALAKQLGVPHKGPVRRKRALRALVATCARDQLVEQQEELSVALAFSDLRERVSQLVASVLSK